MFCSECGKQLTDNSKFCNSCGAKQEISVNSPPVAQPANLIPTPQPIYNSQLSATTPTPTAEQIPTKHKKGKGYLIAGWILAIFGVLSVLGAISNDTYYNYGTLGMTLDDVIMVIFQIACIVVGVAFLVLGYNAKKK